ncbi:MAG: lycopene beta-cyclase CrtY [Sphingomonas fennica]
MRRNAPPDMLIAGGGLAGGLIALALARARPDLRVEIVEAGPAIGGNHLWSFFDSDVTESERALLASLVAHRWEGYDVRFPRHRRTLAGGYNSIPSANLAAAVARALPADAIHTATAITAIAPEAVTLADGRTLPAHAVIDARNAGDLATLDCGWQKFVGREITLPRPHGLSRPIVMDATVPQIDGYRFVYVLPFSPDTLFIEDTYYSGTPDLDVPAIEARIADYAAAHGWHGATITGGETGVLPVVVGGDFDALWDSGAAGIAKVGAAAALFHPTTGYSLPDAARTALWIAGQPDLDPTTLHDRLRARAAAHWRVGGFYRLLDRMLFDAAEPAERYRVLERFYTLDAGLVARFYAGRSTAMDKMRILAGKPPVPVGRAMRAIMGRTNGWTR